MAKNSSPRWHVAPLQRVVAEEITDPAERAALDELRRRSRQNGEPLSAETGNGTLLPEAVSRLLEWCGQLTAEERGALLARLSGELPPMQQVELLSRVLVQLPPAALPALEGEMAARFGARAE